MQTILTQYTNLSVNLIFNLDSQCSFQIKHLEKPTFQKFTPKKKNPRNLTKAQKFFKT